MRYMNYPPTYVPLFPLPLKVGGHVPQLLWERRPCDSVADSRYKFTVWPQTLTLDPPML